MNYYPISLLAELGERLTPDGAPVREGLARGRYLFFNPLLRGAMRGIDAVSGLRHRLDTTLPADFAPRRILVCMQAHIGDLIYASAVIPVLRAAFPQARIDFLVHPAAAVLLADHPEVHTLHTATHWKLDRGAGSRAQKLLRHAREQRVLRARLRECRYDFALDLYAYFPNSIPLLAAARIPVRLGWASGGFGGQLTHARDWRGHGQHVLTWHRMLLDAIPACRAHLDALRPSLPLPLAGRIACARRLHAAGIDGAYLCFHVGAGAPYKRWNESDWIALAATCRKRGDQIVLLGFGRDEIALATRIAAAVPGSANLAGLLDFNALAACIAGARAVVGLDSMAAHLAAAFDVPLVGVFPGVLDDSWRPAGRKTIVVSTPMPCAPCYLPTGCSQMTCLRRTHASAVLAALDSLLQTPEPSHA
ncbi:MAG: glycosyltransferase family 9 protein [Candidatus Dactylopiibacterium sp.]|nr:glycosyltransferase family 9 protein [Candidatus Dactylopiibacterium sp.]